MVIGRGAVSGGGQRHLAARERLREREQPAVLDDHARDRVVAARELGERDALAAPAAAAASRGRP